MRATTLLIATLLIALLTPPGWAANGPKGKGGGREGKEGAGMTTSQAAESARRQTGGRVLSVQDGAGGYRVKVLTPSGEVRDVFVPSGGR